jgi:hypothetical protein
VDDLRAGADELALLRLLLGQVGRGVDARVEHDVHRDLAARHQQTEDLLGHRDRRQRDDDDDVVLLGALDVVAPQARDPGGVDVRVDVRLRADEVRQRGSRSGLALLVAVRVDAGLVEHVEAAGVGGHRHLEVEVGHHGLLAAHRLDGGEGLGDGGFHQLRHELHGKVPLGLLGVTQSLQHGVI